MPGENSVLLGMSGGVDSFVSALMLKQQGYDVTAITFIFYGEKESKNQTIIEAKKLSQRINIKHHTVDVRKLFEDEVIQYFINSYKKGQTPFPCALCNPKVKFAQLIKYAGLFHCKHIATGHYARIKRYRHSQYVFTGTDPEKDQSFFLWGLKGEVVNKLIFPLGDLFKSEVKKIAAENCFEHIASKKESTGLCFVENKDYRKFLKERKIISPPGNFVDQKGNILGKHDGISNYTIGQRRGLGINMQKPVFVQDFCLDDNEIVLSDYKHLFKKQIFIKQYNFINNQEINPDKTYIVKVRYRLQQTPCKINILNDDVLRIELLKPESMIAPGQTAVFYEGDRLIGGGFIYDAN